ncbi:hypothetical protein EZV62_026150 [Acer yangbiense]|uniref:PGG domain-containing protein n=1 Tax=Acer yangbiense TaxID=1000413 RepID=A0A5C7GRQ1_9ROSI|nr:hypothetical protein EZV62_026150 [Acer yangbiense]
MFNISAMKVPYQAVIKENWEDLKTFFDNDRNTFNILYPMTVAKDTAFHIAVHSGREQPLKHLLERVDDPMGANVFMTNAYGNTVLHEAAINHNIAAVKLLVGDEYVTPEQLLKRNRSGQTPLFKAASFGSTKVVRYLASQPKQMICDNKKLEDAHGTRNDGTSILHAAVRGEHFGDHSFFFFFVFIFFLSIYTFTESFSGTALELLKIDEGLAELKTKNGMTSLYLLTNIQSAFGSKYRKQFWHRLVYLCIPTGDDNNDDANNIDEDDQYDDKQVGDNRSKDADCGRLKISGLWPTVTKIWEEKRKRKFAFELARKLIKSDNSWQPSHTEDTIPYFRSLTLEPKDEQIKEKPDQQLNHEYSDDNDEHDQEVQTVVITIEDNNKLEDPKVETPLLAATRTGMIEIVREILKEHPQAVEHISHKKQNILHVAASYRQREVFELVKDMHVPTSRLILGIDEDSYTVLQHVADTKNYPGGSRPGPAYQLQEELEWFKSVEDIMPSFFTKHRDKNNQTARELFKDKHKDQLKDAQKWIKETSQSCSAVAVLVATVVFAAAFTVPGGTDDDNGLPILLDNPFFLFFTIADVISLSSSLTAVVMFLSVLTSPFELEDFRVSLPRRLTLGFALLFMSVATTMLAFTSTVFLIMRLDQRRRWTMTLICCAAFFPVSVLALTHFPLFVSFVNAWKNLFMAIWEAPPCSLVVGCLASVLKRVRWLQPEKKDH